MNSGPYTRLSMDAARAESAARDVRDSADLRPDGLQAEAGATVAHSAATLRSVSERYREAYIAELAQWQAMASELDELERRPEGAGSDDIRLPAMAAQVQALGADLARHRTELAKLELALRTIEGTRQFLERDGANPSLAEVGDSAEAQLRIVQAQEAERSRLAQEIHDGPAQALSNAIFQIEYIERLSERDERLAGMELRYLKEVLRRDLGDVRTLISRLRPPALEEFGLDGAINDAVEHAAAVTGLSIGTDLGAPADRLGEAQQTVALRIVQEALQNVRKHAVATVVSVTTRLEGGDWVLEVRDDGRGFDVGAVSSRGRSNFGLQFMRERAELVGARFEVRSRPDGGTVIKLSIPVGGEESS